MPDRAVTLTIATAASLAAPVLAAAGTASTIRPHTVPPPARRPGVTRRPACRPVPAPTPV